MDDIVSELNPLRARGRGRIVLEEIQEVICPQLALRLAGDKLPGGEELLL
jgi:hypothetical protein